MVGAGGSGEEMALVPQRVTFRPLRALEHCAMLSQDRLAGVTWGRTHGRPEQAGLSDSHTRRGSGHWSWR